MTVKNKLNHRLIHLMLSLRLFEQTVHWVAPHRLGAHQRRLSQSVRTFDAVRGRTCATFLPKKGHNLSVKVISRLAIMLSLIKSKNDHCG